MGAIKKLRMFACGHHVTGYFAEGTNQVYCKCNLGLHVVCIFVPLSWKDIFKTLAYSYVYGFVKSYGHYTLLLRLN